MTFNDLNLNGVLLRALDDMGFTNPSPIQQQAFPLIMSGKDLIGIAQTGTGKTFAYLLPLLRLYKYDKKKEPKILILVPTRELVVQLVSEVEKLASHMSFDVIGIYGGVNINTQKKQLLGGCDMIVGTPGRVMDLSLFGSIKASLIKKLVIDEFDEMLHHGFKHQLNTILDLLPKKRQNLLFSATFNQDVKKIMGTYFAYPKILEITPSGTPLKQIHQFRYSVQNFLTKKNLVIHLLSDSTVYEKVLIFAGSKKRADLLEPYLAAAFPDKVGIIHSNKSQNFRIRTVEEFESNKKSILISTDLVARGIDISDITHVINFDMPLEAETYLHRIGRTGRADKAGSAVAFISDTDNEIIQSIEDLMQLPIATLPMPEEVEIDATLLEEEIDTHKAGDKSYLKLHSLKDSKGAFHEKSSKNSKENQGGSYRRKLKAKYKKPQRRSGKK